MYVQTHVQCARCLHAETAYVTVCRGGEVSEFDMQTMEIYSGSQLTIT